jgi:hypothetical protein
MSYKEPALVERLIGRLQETDGAVTIVHHDPTGSDPPKLPPGARAALLPNPHSVRWATFDIVEALIKCMQWARRQVPDYSWLVPISGQDYPIMSPRAIEAELLASQADAYMRWEFTPPFARSHNSDWQQGTSHRYYWRVAPGTTRPIPWPRLRWYFDGVGVFAGSLWTTFGRRAVERVFADEQLLAHLRKRFARPMAPSEGFFQTLLMNAPIGLSIVNDDRRFYDFPKTGGSGHPRILTLDRLDELLATNVQFARKVEQEASAPLLDALDELHARSGAQPAA